MENQLYIFGFDAAEFNTILLFTIITLLGMLAYKAYQNVFSRLTAIRWRSASEYEVNQQLQKLTADLSVYAMIAADVHGKILSFNQTATEIFGHTQQEVLGRNIDLLIPLRYRQRHSEGMKRWRETGKSNVVNNPDGIELTGLHKDGTEFPIQLILKEINDKGFKFIAGYIRNNTKDKQREDVWKDKVHLLEAGEMVAEMATWYWELKPEADVVVSDNFYSIFNVDKGDSMTSPDLMGLVYPEDGLGLVTLINDSVENKQDYKVKYRRLQKDGSLACIEARGHMELDDNGEVFAITGTVQIIPNDKHNERNGNT